MANYSYPTSSELTLIAQNFQARRQLDNVIFRHFPVRSVDSHVLQWEQKDNYIGLQQVRGLNGEPGRVAAVGGKRYVMRPGVYGEYLPIDEDELTARRQWGSFNAPISLDDLVMEKTEQLVVREVTRITQILWTLVSTGTFSIAHDNGAVVHTDTYTTQTYNATTWATASGATPIYDLQQVALKEHGYSVSFGPDARAYMNRATAFAMLNNTNADDLGGKRTNNGPFSLTDANRIFVDQGLPTVEIMDEGYYSDAGVWTQYLANNVVVVIGQRPAGESLGEYRYTRNANNDGMAPGPYTKVWENDKPPARVEVHRGQSGGPVIFYPSSIVIVDVS